MWQVCPKRLYKSREKMLEIPFEKYEAILKSEREKSIKYLKTAIDSCLRKKDGH